MSMLAYGTHIIGSRASTNTLEVFLDFVCPFSKKQLQSFYVNVIPLIESGAVDAKVVLRQVPQPWHSSSTLTHEAALGVATVLAKTKGDNFNDPDIVKDFQRFFKELMDRQDEFYDEPCANETTNQTRERLADIAASYVDRKTYLEAVSVGKGNSGTAVTFDLKQAIKYGRQMGVHVTPTVTFNGLVEPSIESSFSKQDWEKYFADKKIIRK